MAARCARSIGLRGTTGEEAASGFSHSFVVSTSVIETPHVDHHRRVFLCSMLRSPFCFSISLPWCLSLSFRILPTQKLERFFCKKLGLPPGMLDAAKPIVHADTLLDLRAEPAGAQPDMGNALFDGMFGSSAMENWTTTKNSWKNCMVEP
jgi:hypothetical protein